MLNESIENYGLCNIETIRLSQKRDREIEEQQRKIYENWKKRVSECY